MCLKKDSLLNLALIADLDPEVVSLDVKQFGKYIRDDGPVNRYFRNWVFWLNICTLWVCNSASVQTPPDHWRHSEGVDHV